VSVAGARTILGRIVAAYGGGSGDLVAFPSASVLAAADPGDVAGLGMPGARARTVVTVAQAVASDALDLRAGDPAEVGEALERLPGVGPWTSSYVRLRALADPDVLPVTDLGIRHGARDAGLPDDPRALAEHARAWSPWRSYAAQHLWTPTPASEETS
jgi:AraC family transcriptional regulator of adaptative response / DNA-3-methyladenine glycosylase II